MIKIITLGKLKEQYLINMIEDYHKRLNKYHKTQIIELKDQNDLYKESLDIKKHIDQGTYLVVLDIQGKSLSSEELAQLIDKTFISYSTITFIIGSSEGIDDSIKEIANLRLSFSAMTFPHGLFRGLLLEQIYRAMKINNNESYHK